MGKAVAAADRDDAASPPRPARWWLRSPGDEPPARSPAGGCVRRSPPPELPIDGAGRCNRSRSRGADSLAYVGGHQQVKEQASRRLGQYFVSSFVST